MNGHTLLFSDVHGTSRACRVLVGDRLHLLGLWCTDAVRWRSVKKVIAARMTRDCTSVPDEKQFPQNVAVNTGTWRAHLSSVANIVVATISTSFSRRAPRGTMDALPSSWRGETKQLRRCGRASVGGVIRKWARQSRRNNTFFSAVLRREPLLLQMDVTYCLHLLMSLVAAKVAHERLQLDGHLKMSAAGVTETAQQTVG